jgi:hypothetical protein
MHWSICNGTVNLFVGMKYIDELFMHNERYVLVEQETWKPSQKVKDEDQSGSSSIIPCSWIIHLKILLTCILIDAPQWLVYRISER